MKTLVGWVFNRVTDTADWLTWVLRCLLTKNYKTENPKNYKCQNIILKLFTSCINQFLQDHCEINKLVTTEYTGDKKNICSYLEQNNLRLIKPYYRR